MLRISKMDKRNFTLGLLCLAAAFGVMFWQGSGRQQAAGAEVKQTDPVVVADVVKKESFKVVARNKDKESKESVYVLENAYLKVHLTNAGGAIVSVELKQHPVSAVNRSAFVFNRQGDENVLALGTKEGSGIVLDTTLWALKNQTEHSVEFSKRTHDGVEVVRQYTLADREDPYVLTHEVIWKNTAPVAVVLPNFYMSMGHYSPIGNQAYDEYLNFGYYDGKDAKFIKVNDFKGSAGFLGVGKRLPTSVVEQNVPVRWASVKNQFFATILTPKTAGEGIVSVPKQLKDGETTVSGYVAFVGTTLQPGQTLEQAATLYVGPKEYTRLNRMSEHQDLVMQFGFFALVTKLLLVLMLGVHAIIPNWGWAIVAITILIKMLLWPVTAAQVRSAKGMAAIQKPLQELKAKYGSNQKKLQAETLKLFKENKVNPAAGCLPLLVQIPIFLGLYFMLRTASELRLQEFLWAKDLSMPDTIGHFYGFPINPMPLVMAALMWLQMKFSPSSGAGSQQKILQLMPLIFLLFSYSFPSGLVLYWTVQSILTIVQQYWMNRKQVDTVKS